MVGYLGTTSAIIETAFTGGVVAPNAELILGGQERDFAGTFQAKTLTIGPDCRLRFASPPGSQ